MAKKRPNRFSDELRRAVDDCGITRYRIAKTMGVSESLLSRFMSGAWLGQETLDAMAELLDLHVVAGKRRKKKG
jgi:transcriptional regulator with XRE-family HTH domain